MPGRFCVCGGVALRGTKCERCASRPAPKRKRGSTKTNGYDNRWKELSLAYRKDYPICEACGIADAEETHHVQPISKRPDLRLDWGNLRALCRECHREAHRIDGDHPGFLLEG